jgi:hypothetical protein
VEEKTLSNPNPNLKSKPVWQPLPKLQPLEMHPDGFQKSSLQSSKRALFEAWTTEENQLLGFKHSQSYGLAKSVKLLGTDAASQIADAQEVAHQAGESLQKIDSTFLESIKNDAFQNGFLEGKRVQKEEFEKAEQEQLVAELKTQADETEKNNLHLTSLLAEISKSAKAIIQKPDQLHEPLKRLALHLAEQLTLAELSLSSNSIQSLIERAVETLDLGHNVSLTVELNPADLSLLQSRSPITGEEETSWRLVADAHLLPGSVRVRADDSVVSDFVENRLESLAQSLLLEPSPWQTQSAFQPGRLSARFNATSNIEDALPRNSPPLNQPLSDPGRDPEILDDPINFSEKTQNDND